MKFFLILYIQNLLYQEKKAMLLQNVFQLKEKLLKLPVESQIVEMNIKLSLVIGSYLRMDNLR